MKIIQLIALPLLSLIFALFIYWLAVDQIPPKPVKKNPIRILPLQEVENTDRQKLDTILAKKISPPSSETETATEKTDVDITNPDLDTSTIIDLKMFNKKPFIKEQYRFIPSDRMYLVMEFQNLDAGQHLVSASWINPAGKAISQTDHTIDLAEPAEKHRSYFWLELMKNGTLTEMFTGKEYKGNVYGKWEVQVHLNGNLVAKKYFNIQDT
jgi:hypothetical protein